MILSDSIIFKIYRDIYLNISSRYPIGTNVFEKDWDVLLLLDTCRVDALREVAPEYDFLNINSIGSIVSVGSTSAEWIASTFVPEYINNIKETVYVSGNAYSQWVLEDREFPHSNSIIDYTNWSTVHANELLELDQPWRYASDPIHGHIRPPPITDRAIMHGRETCPKRLIVHYSQPHEPYTAIADAEGRTELYEYEQEPFEYLKAGGHRDKIWNLYLENLRMVLDSVKTLLNHIDANTVAISADHGEAFGEYGFYRHPAAAPHPHIKRVPWAVTSAVDKGDYSPTVEPEGPEKAVSAHLKDLGYL